MVKETFWNIKIPERAKELKGAREDFFNEKGVGALVVGATAIGVTGGAACGIYLPYRVGIGELGVILGPVGACFGGSVGACLAFGMLDIWANFYYGRKMFSQLKEANPNPTKRQLKSVRIYSGLESEPSEANHCSSGGGGGMGGGGGSYDGGDSSSTNAACSFVP